MRWLWRRLVALVVALLLLAPALAGGPKPANAAAIALRQKSAAVATSALGTVTPSLPAASTAGDLLVAVLGSDNATTGFSGPAGWTRATQVASTNDRAEIWYRGNIPAGLTNAAFTGPALANLRGVLAEYSGADATAPLDVTGTNTATNVNNVTVTTPSTVAPGDVGVTAFTLRRTLAANMAWTPGLGWTNLRALTGSQTVGFTGDYRLNLAKAAASETQTNTQTGNWAAALATFKLPCTGGALTITPPASVSFGSLALNGTNQTATTTVPITPSDLSGNQTGWNVSLSATQFTNAGGKTLPANAASVTSGAPSAVTGNCALPTNSVGYPVTLGATANKVYNAAASTPGTGPVNVNLGSQLAVPGGAYSGSYSSTWTYTIASGP